MKPTYIVLKESFAQSVLADAITFSFMLLCVYVSRDSNTWTFISASMFLIFFFAKISVALGTAKSVQVYSIDELEEWVSKEKERQK